MFYFAHGGVDDGHPNEPALSTPDIRMQPLPQSATSTTQSTDSAHTSDIWLPLAGLAIGTVVLIAVAIILVLKRKKAV